MSKILLYRGGEPYELTEYGREKLIERWMLKNKKEMIDKFNTDDIMFMQSIKYRTDQDLIELVEMYGCGILQVEDNESYRITEIGDNVNLDGCIIEEYEPYGFNERVVCVLAEF